MRVHGAVRTQARTLLSGFRAPRVAGPAAWNPQRCASTWALRPTVLLASRTPCQWQPRRFQSNAAAAVLEAANAEPEALAQETIIENLNPEEAARLSKVRNIGIAAHIDSGKTTVTERVLYYTGRIAAIHEVRGKDAVGAKMDSMDLEREKGITIQSAATFCDWIKNENGKDETYHINLIDTPGHIDFTIEVERALRVLDGAVMILCAVSGVQSQTITVDRQMRRYNVPRVSFINKMDRMGANPFKAVDQINQKLRIPAAALQVPIGTEDEFKGVVDLIRMKAIYNEGKKGELIRESDEIPESVRELAEEKRRVMIETLADVDEEIAEIFLDEREPSIEQIKAAVRRATISLKFTPVLMGSALADTAVQPMLDAVVDYLPNPSEVENMALDQRQAEKPVKLVSYNSLPFVGLAFKLEESNYGQLTYIRVYQGTLRKGMNVFNARNNKKVKIPRIVRMHSNEMEEIPEIGAGEICAVFGVDCASGDTFTDGTLGYSMTSMFVPEPVISLSIKPKNAKETANFSKAMSRFQREDPTFRVHVDSESQETIISGMGELHLDIYVERMRREYKVACETGQPQVSYRETITTRVPFDHTLKKQTGGAGDYARVVGWMEPTESLEENHFEQQISGGSISEKFLFACDKGFQASCDKGPLLGHRVLGTSMVINDGATHMTDSSEMAFKIATQQAFRKTFVQAKPQVLEPLMKTTITAPNEFQGNIVGLLNKRNAVINDTEIGPEDFTLYADCSLNSMFGFSTQLRAATQGKGEFSMEFSHYSPAPMQLQRRQAGEEQRNETPSSQSQPQSSQEAASLETEGFTELGRGTEDYGVYTVELSNNQRISVILNPSSLPNIDQLQESHSLTRDEAAQARNAIEQGFLYGMLAAELPPHHRININGPGGQLLRRELMHRGFLAENVNRAIERFDNRVLEGTSSQTDGITEETNTNSQDTHTTQALDERETVVDVDSEFSWRGDDSASSREGQSLLNLLYHIAEDQARREGYVHRGVTCNSCGTMPIRGIRYRCANCIDFDLCETCEAMQVHPKTHLFYKVRIPAPFLGNPRQAQPVWYPGKPTMLPQALPNGLGKKLVKETGFENSEVDALWDQFKCLASSEWQEDPNKLNMAIDRRSFDKCFVPNTAIRPPPPNLIYDRMFAFYDTNGDGLIGFEEFLKGLSSLNNKNKDEKLRKVFQGYDIDGDGFVDRKDFLRMFRAFYALSKELTKDMVAGMEEDVIESGGARDIVLGSQPISSAFSGAIPPGERSRTGEGKRPDEYGDLQLVDNQGAVRESGDDRGSRDEIIAEAAERAAYGEPSSSRRPWESMFVPDDQGNEALEEALEEAMTRATEQLQDGPTRIIEIIHGNANEASGGSGDSDDENHEDWPPEYVIVEDVETALGSYLALADIHSPEDRNKIRKAARRRLDDEARRKREAARREGLNERWRRRQFYLDDEDGSTPPADYEEESEKEGGKEAAEKSTSPPGSRPPSLRSRSSSKVRFQDDLTDDNYDTRSNPSTSSRSIPVGERWGGYEIPEAEKDVGKEVLYQVAQQGINELLDPLFKAKEDLAMEVLATKTEREKWRSKISEYEEEKSRGKGKEKATESKPNGVAAHSSRVSTTTEDVTEPFPNINGTANESISGDSQLNPSTEQPSLHPTRSTPAPEDRSTRGLDRPDIDPSAIDPTILAKPLDALLNESGYAVEESSPINAGPSRSQESPRDPTLPQNRPNSSSPFPIPTESSSKLPSARADRLALLSTAPSFAEKVPSRNRLGKLSQLSGMEREIAERGGPGKLSFAEFEEVMKSDKGRKLQFVGAYIEMASF
ncbi:MAG: hypothetical protein M1819_007287 [Sarea resinae]|nr:MAG: hypothetical protein M1819_007287 [Sarea resinae]